MEPHKRIPKRAEDVFVTVHELKCWPEYFQAVYDKLKRFELRKNDRGYKVDDALLIREFDPKTNEYTGRAVYRIVTYMVTDTRFGLQPGYCILGIEPLPANIELPF